jgi:hypothetical protein
MQCALRTQATSHLVLGSAILLICADMVVCSLNMLRYETYRGEKSALQTAERISSRLKSLGVQKCDLSHSRTFLSESGRDAGSLVECLASLTITERSSGGHGNAAQ